MPKFRSWSDDDLLEAVRASRSYRAAIIKLGLVPAGGNYVQVQQAVERLGADTSHFTGKGWNEGWRSGYKRDERIKALQDVLIIGSTTQSYGLKKRLFHAGLKEPRCELCGWHEMSQDGRIPVELDHINGNHYDNRLENLRVLCPNCHSLQPTHRGKNKKVLLTKLSAGGVIGSHEGLKIPCPKGVRVQVPPRAPTANFFQFSAHFAPFFVWRHEAPTKCFQGGEKNFGQP